MGNAGNGGKLREGRGIARVLSGAGSLGNSIQKKPVLKWFEPCCGVKTERKRARPGRPGIGMEGQPGRASGGACVRPGGGTIQRAT